MKFAKTMTMLLVLSLTLWSQESEGVRLNLRDMGVRQFVEMIGKIMHKNILINGELRGKINFIANEPIKRESVFSLANSILASKGYALVDHGDFMEVVKASEAAGMGLAVDTNASGETMKTVLFPLKKSNAAVIRAKIRPLLPRNAKVVSFKEDNILSVTAFPKTLRSIKKLIDALEQAGNKGSAVIRLKNASAKEVYSNAVNMAKQLFPQTIPSERVGVFKDDATNSIIVVGKKENVRRMLRYIKQLDRKGESVTQKLYVVPLKNSDAEEMQKILSRLLAQMNNLSRPAARKGGKPPKKATVVADTERNALIILATGGQMKNIRAVLNRIDVEKPQVYIKARVVEINLNKAQQVGVRYGFEGGKITSSGLFTLAGNTGNPSLMISSKLLGFLSKQQTDNNGNVVTTNPFGRENVSELFALGAKIDLLKENGAAHILSEPSVLCSNNQESEIYVGRTQSILVKAQQSTQGQGNIINSYSREDIGITLKVKPRLSSRNKVALKVEATIEDILPGSGSSADRPTTTKRKVTTNAIVSNGQTIILGGLVKSSSGKSVTKIPILGDIPLLGALFRSTGSGESTTNVVVYLTPYIIRHSSDLEKLKRFLSELEVIQARYNRFIRERLSGRERSDADAPMRILSDRYESTHPRAAAEQRERMAREYRRTHRDPLEILKTHP